jgi:DNA-binding IscR family transcriptional regulator
VARILEVLGKPLFDSGFCLQHRSSDASDCSRLTDCSLRPVWAHLDALLKRVFEHTTLADLTAGERLTDKHLQERWPLIVPQGRGSGTGAGGPRERGTQ